MQKSMSLEYESASEPLHSFVKKLFLKLVLKSWPRQNVKTALCEMIF